MVSTEVRRVFDRPELLENQTRLILSADNKPRRLARSGHRSAGLTFVRDQSNSPISNSADDELLDDLLDDQNHDDDETNELFDLKRQFVNYDSDLESEDEIRSDFSSKSVYLEQCRRYGIIPSSYFLRNFQNENLQIRFCALKPIQIKAMIPALKINPHVTRLDLSSNDLGSTGVFYLSKLIAETEFINELNLSDNNIGLQGCKALCEVLCLNRTVRRIFLDGNRLNDDCAKFLSEVFRQNESIEFFSLSKNFFENEAAARLLGQSLAENATIKEFSLSWNRLRAKSFAAFIKPLSKNEQLNVLDLSSNSGDLLAAKAFFDFLRKTLTLEKLLLNSNRFNTEAAIFIGRALAKNQSLKYLNLQSNPLESSGCFALINSLIKNPTSPIESIDFRGVIVNQDFLDLMAKLKTVLPNLKVHLAR